MKPAPVALFAYRRLDHLQATVSALRQNCGAAETDLWAFSEASRDARDAADVAAVREYLHNITGFTNITVVERERHLGLANSVIDGVSTVCRKYGNVIVVEDDLVTSPYFLNFMNKALTYYERFPRVFSISGWAPPTSFVRLPGDYQADLYISYRPTSWGWATWWDRWKVADWEVNDFLDFRRDTHAVKLFTRGGLDLMDMLNRQMRGEIDSWYIRWCYSHYKHDAVCVSPVFSYVDNIGHDATGTHCKAVFTKWHTDITSSKPTVEMLNTNEVDQRIAAVIWRAWSGSPFIRLRGRLGYIKHNLFKILLRSARKQSG